LSEQVEAEEQEAETSSLVPDDDMDEFDHPIKSFIRTVLVVAGLYGTRQNPGNLPSDYEASKPIPKRVLEEVESSSSTLAAAAAAEVDRRLLLDLINEALPGAVRASTTLGTFDKCWRRVPSGKKLLEALWKSVQVWLDPPSDKTTSSSASVDVLIERDLSMSAWHGEFRDDADELGGEVEADVLDELVDEMVWDVLLNVGDFGCSKTTPSKKLTAAIQADDSSPAGGWETSAPKTIVGTSETKCMPLVMDAFSRTVLRPPT